MMQDMNETDNKQKKGGGMFNKIKAVSRRAATVVNLIANEKVAIVNNNNGERFETYIIKGERDRKSVV